MSFLGGKTTPLAWLNLVHNRVRTSVAVAGVSFAIVLMFMQLGFLEAVKASATLIYDVLEFDICIRSPDYLNLADARTFPRNRLVQAKGVAGVDNVVPFHTGLNTWRHPGNGEKRGILIMGFRPEDAVFRDERIAQAARRNLHSPELAVIDTKTRREFGPTDGRQFGDQDVGLETEVGSHRVRIAGHFTRGAGLVASGALLVDERGFFRLIPRLSDRVSFALVTLAPGENAESVAQRLRDALPNDVEVLTRQQTLERETRRWVYETNYGLIFLSGVLVAVIVGTAIVYQVLTSEVSSLLPEYATLRAMGYPNRFLIRVVLQQALILALCGFLPGLAISQAMYTVTSAGAVIPIRFTWINVLSVFSLSILMCIVSGLLAARKTFQADPADLF